MPLSNKSKISILLLIFASITIFSSMALKAKSTNIPDANNSQSTKEVDKPSQQLIPATKNANTVQVTDIAPSTNQLNSLAGEVDPKTGVRLDILKYIEQTIPQDNVAARSAAIVLAATTQKIYYQSTQSEALKLSKKQFIAMHCLSRAFSSKGRHLITKKINELMRDTPDRDKHMWDIDERYFGWRTIGISNLSIDQINNICDKSIVA